MSFLNITLLLGLLGIGIPIALHLIARREPKEVRFPSVRLLSQRFETNRSKIRIRRWWLLALRIAAIAAVALSLARPTISGALSLTWSTIAIVAAAGVGLLALASVAASRPQQKTLMWSLLGTAIFTLLLAMGWGGYTLASGKKPDREQSIPVALAIVVDNSPLSAWRTGDDRQLDRWKSRARQLVTQAGSQGRVAIVDRSSTPATFSLDAAGALSKIEQLKPLTLTMPLRARMEAAVRVLESSDIPTRHLVVLSDWTKSSLAMEDSGLATEDSGPSRLASKIQELGIRVTALDGGPLTGSNRRLSLPSFSNQAPAPGESVTISTTLSLSGTSLSETSAAANADSGAAVTEQSVDVTAECLLYPANPSLPVVRNGVMVRPDGRAVDRVSDELSLGRDVNLQLSLPPLPQGLHHGELRLIGDDSLALDDAVYFTVSVLAPSRLLIVGDVVEEAQIIGRMVNAPVAIDDPTAAYAVAILSYEDFPAARLDDFEGVILLDPSRSVLEAPQVGSFMRSGGSLLIAAGRRLGQESFQPDGWPAFERRWRIPEPGSFLEITAPSHPALNPLTALPGGVPFADFRISQYWEVNPGNHPVLMRYAGTQHAALLEVSMKTEGEVSPGRVLILTTPIPEVANPSTAWNELFSFDDYWPSFSLVRELTRYVSGRNVEDWTRSVGSSVFLPIERPESREASADTTDVNEPAAGKGIGRLQWFPPVGMSPIPIDLPNPGAQNRSEFSGADAKRVSKALIGRPKDPGIHWVRGAQPGLGFTVNVPREDLSLERIDFEVLEKILGRDSLSIVTSIDEMDWAAGQAQPVVPLWSPIMLTALLVFLIEQILSNRFYQRRAGGTPNRTVKQSIGRPAA